MSIYKNKSAKSIISKGYVFATFATNSKLKTQFRKDMLGKTKILTVASTNFGYDIYCKPDDLQKVKSIYQS